MEFSWSMVAAICSIVAVIGLFALLWLRWKLSGEFTPNEAFKALLAKVASMEHDLRIAPTHRDIQGLSDRVRAVELGVAVVQETVTGLKDSMAKIDRGVARIEEHLLDGAK